MKAFNEVLNKIVEVERLEDLNSKCVLISESQEKEIEESLNNEGHVYITEGKVISSGPKKIDHIYNKDSNSWVFSQSLYESRIVKDREEAWEKIKKERSKSQVSGVYISSVNKWFHTDEEAQRNYLFLKVVIDYKEFEPPYWKTMDGSYVLMTPELYKQVVQGMYAKALFDFKNAEYLYSEMMKSEEPSKFDCTYGWSRSYYSTIT